MRKSIKKAFSLILATIILVVGLPAAGITLEAKAEDGEFTEGYLSYFVENGEATITGCDESISGEFVIPDTLGGYPVTRIGSSAFWGCTGLTGVTIPDNVTSINDYAFYGCTELINISIPDGLTSMGRDVFDKTKWYSEQYEDNIYKKYLL